MLKAAAAAALAVAFAGAASAQNAPAQPSTPERGITGARAPQHQPHPLAGESGADAARRSGAVDLNNNRTTGRVVSRPRGAGTVPQRLGPISPGTGAHDSGVPDSSTYNPSTPAIR